MSGEVRSFTTQYAGKSSQLRNDVKIISGGKTIVVNALWDTGASGSCISYDVAQALNLAVVGKSEIRTPSGQMEVNLYAVDIQLPNGLLVADVPVSDSDIGKQGIGLLVGMNIITLGDFAVSNYEGKTMFTFRVPSQRQIDFVMESRIGTHGQGKRKKKRK